MLQAAIGSLRSVLAGERAHRVGNTRGPMFKVSRKSEYALIAVQHMSRQPRDHLVSVAELASAEGIPQDILAKVLQGLKRAGILSATKGSGGGYRLSRPITDIGFLEVVRPFEEQLAVVSCQTDAGAGCDRDDGCSLKDPMTILNAFVMRQFEALTMDMFMTPHVLLTAPTVASGGRMPMGNAHPVVPPRRDPVPAMLVETGLGRRTRDAEPRPDSQG